MRKKLNCHGLTLVEILVAITIVGLAAAVGIPNLKKYSEDQELPNVASDLVRVLRQAQSSALTHVVCADGSSSYQWVVYIYNNMFNYAVICSPTPTRPFRIETTLYTKSFSNTTLSSNSCDPLNSVVIFQNSKVDFHCPIGITTSAPFSIILQKPGVSSKQICISQAGAVDIKDYPSTC